jgi:hypothetical protein
VWRGTVAVWAFAAITLLAAVAAGAAAGVPLRDPAHVSVERLVVTLALGALVVGADLVVRASRRSRGLVPSRAALGAAARERWSARRLAVVLLALVAFYLTYFAYRNLKSVVPVLRPGVLFDHQLADLDRDLFGGRDPGALLHDLLGTGLAAHVLSMAYMAFFTFIPFALALALGLSTSLAAGVFLVAALAANWMLGAGSYYLLPSLGPFHADPAAFAGLPATAAGHMQEKLTLGRALFLHDPGAPGAAQSIGAFASLHCSIWCTAAVATHLLGLRRAWRVAAWGLFALTVLATVYFGWHYLLDDVAGVFIALAALGLARVATGFDLGRARREARRRVPTPAPEPA